MFFGYSAAELDDVVVVYNFADMNTVELAAIRQACLDGAPRPLELRNLVTPVSCVTSIGVDKMAQIAVAADQRAAARFAQTDRQWAAMQATIGLFHGSDSLVDLCGAEPVSVDALINVRG
ncbi:hypothetical protein BCF44_12623 [Kutzneria buriramensis]|uniref:Uncharacterized protein n=2 Tax=Kutzneria buriramensis TaxID=1045776 RepID=A0A3E0GUL5_9PSEU|nr:hypothetical protein BCF44_12623 [Kutzneria buriramensis]